MRRVLEKFRDARGGALFAGSGYVIATVRVIRKASRIVSRLSSKESNWVFR